MDATSQIAVVLKPEMVRSGLKLNSLKPGRTLLLKVLELKGDRALIDFGNFRATADTKIPVALGEELLVKVQESGKQLTLRLLNPAFRASSVSDSAPRAPDILSADVLKRFQSDIKQILNQFPAALPGNILPDKIFNVLRMLDAYFETIDLKKIMAELLPRLKSQVDHSGLFFEKMLESVIAKLTDDSRNAPTRQLANHPSVLSILNTDLKANLAVLKQSMAGDAALQNALDGRTLTSLREAVDLLLADIASQQGRAVRQLDAADPFQMFTYTLPLKEENQAARIKVYYQKKQKTGSKNGFRISLLLAMDRLGKLRTDFYLLERDLTMTFFVKDSSIEAKIKENCPGLQAILDPFFNQTLVRVVVSEKKIKQFEHEELSGTSDKNVDIRI